jgi:hypothetical protein
MPEIEKLLTEQPNPASASIDALPTEEVLRIINQEDRQVADAVGRELASIARAAHFCAAHRAAPGKGRKPKPAPKDQPSLFDEQGGLLESSGYRAYPGDHSGRRQSLKLTSTTAAHRI